MCWEAEGTGAGPGRGRGSGRRAGAGCRAAGPVPRLGRDDQRTGAAGLAARCRALLATGDTATAEFQTALELHTLTNRPTDQARTQLLVGEHLRRARRRADARRRAAGEATPRPAPNRLAALTSQELRIAAAVSGGASNRQIAAQLFLSPRTVDYHLRKVFQKTGITSRADLVRLVLAEHDA